MYLKTGGNPRILTASLNDEGYTILTHPEQVGGGGGGKRKKKRSKKEADVERAERDAKSSKAMADASAAMEGARSGSLITQPINLVGGQLKPYQLEGLQWMMNLFYQGLNGILADEMVRAVVWGGRPQSSWEKGAGSDDRCSGGQVWCRWVLTWKRVLSPSFLDCGMLYASLFLL